MKCKDFERDIYLYAELSEAERMRVNTHIQQCASCKELFELVSSTQSLIARNSVTKPELVNHARLTSNIMQAVIKQQKQPASWINSVFVKYAMAAVSLALVISFGAEQLSPVEPLYKRIPAAKTVTLNSASFMKAEFDRKENPEAARPSLYACVKSGNCENILIENLKKKSL